MKTHPQFLFTAAILVALSSTATALAQTPTPGTPLRMKAIVYHEFGSPDVLRLEEVDKPVPLDNQLLIRVRAVSINPLDWHYMEGTPYIGRLPEFGLLEPKTGRLGVDYAGTVEAVGKKITEFKPGDEVFGNRFGAFAEYVVASDKGLTFKPAALTFEQAASLPVAGLTALQGVRDYGKTQPGQKVLINGASGGVGTFAVQIAKTFGAEVTGVCSGRNVELVRSLGADHVIDYTKEDFTKRPERYDLILDNVGNQSLSRFRGSLTPTGKYVVIGGGGINDSRWTGPLNGVIKMLILKPFVTQELRMMLADVNRKDLNALADLVQAGKMKPAIDRTYPLSQLRDAMAYLEQGHARGKVVITVGDNIEPLATTTNRAPESATTTGPMAVAIGLIGVPLAVLILPIVLAISLNRRFRQRNPDKRAYRWGYYFSIMSLIAGVLLGSFLELGATGMILSGFVYALLAWFFARRHHWAWIALTILSFNPVAWIINAIYLWRRWREPAIATLAV